MVGLPRLPLTGRDLSIAIGLGLVCATLSLTTARALPTAISEPHNRDVWFQTAVDSVTKLAGDRLHTKHGRNNTHPFFSVMIHPPARALTEAAEVDVLQALRVIVAVAALVWGAGVFVLLRLIRCRTLDAVLLCGLSIFSASALFFFAVPETFSFGSLGIVLAFIVLAWADRVRLPAWIYVCVNLATFASVITNWSLGLLVTFASNPRRVAARIVATFVIVAAGVIVVEKQIYPSLRAIWDVSDELNFVHHPDSGGPVAITTSFVYHSVIAPAIMTLERPNAYRDPGVPSALMTVQSSAPGSGSPWGIGLAIVWTLLLATGAWALFTLEELRRVRSVLGLFLLAQWLLHVNYGEETFLYSLHFTVPLVLLPALATRTRLRPLVIGLLLLFVPALAVNNLQQFGEAVALFGELQLPSASPPMRGPS